MTAIYPVFAREVVPGMSLAPGWDIVDVRREDGEILIAWRDRDVGDACHYLPDDTVSVILPGPSPRELCCSCVGHGSDGDRCDDPQLHADGCPVAPVTGLHGGLRLWPAPGAYGQWEHLQSHGTSVWCDPMTDVHAAWLRDWDKQLDEVIERDRPPRDYVLQCFFLPPAPPDLTGDRAAWEVARVRKGYR